MLEAMLISFSVGCVCWLVWVFCDAVSYAKDVSYRAPVQPTRIFFLSDSERAFLQREPWLFCTVLFVLLIAVTVGGGYLRVHGLI
jgi:hypothetical protein